MKKDKSDKTSLDENIKIRRLGEELQSQNEELQQQEGELSYEREKLKEAYTIIEQKQKEITEYDAQLEDRVAQKSHELIKRNEELQKKNNNLLQFSYTVSHDLKNPIARLLALGDLLKTETDEYQKDIIADLIYKTTKELEMVVTELSTTIDFDTDKNKEHQTLFLDEIWRNVMEILIHELPEEIVITTDFSKASVITGSRPMVHSILYNLATNSVKYRSPDRSPKINISTRTEINGDLALIFEDNGVGIDLQKHQHDMFVLHKRFHSHVEGTGVGLYLIKTQMEAMNGAITVDSTLDQGTTFTLYFKKNSQSDESNQLDLYS